LGCLYIKLGDIGMVSINSNYAASFAATAAKQTTSALDSAMEKLSTGKRINYARDDAAGQAIATRLTAEIQGLAAASRNASDGQALLDTAEGALSETQTLLLRMRELAVQSSNGTLAAADRAALEKEAQALETEITRIADTTTWAGVNLLDGSLSDGVTIQAGTDAGGANLITVSIAEMSSSAATINIATQSIGTFTDAQAAITAIDGALSGVSEVRGALGAISNRLNSTIANMDQVRVNLSASVGRIEDADFAQETGNLAKNQILQQAATAMLAQANASKSSVLNLLRG
jgi:flagellin